ncbi:MAG: hypothetical protein ACLSAH_12420 [Bilophila wadsworthia]
MGTCQGRMCSAAVAEMIAHAHGLPIETLPPYHAQPPLFPLQLEELASMSIPPKDYSRQAVISHKRSGFLFPATARAPVPTPRGPRRRRRRAGIPFPGVPEPSAGGAFPA